MNTIKMQYNNLRFHILPSVLTGSKQDTASADSLGSSEKLMNFFAYSL